MGADDILEQALSRIKHTDHTSLKHLKTARQNLSTRYKNTREAGFKNDTERLAYILARLPATYAVCRDVLQKIPKDFPINSVLDLGAGPGTATLAAISLQIGHSYTLLEQDALMLEKAKMLLTPLAENLSFHQQNLLTHSSLPRSDFLSDNHKADLVIVSYVLGEMSRPEQIEVITKALSATRHYLVIVSPGTSTLFDDYLAWRTYLMDHAARILAPCPAQTSCPMEGHSRWCHFKTRVQRTKELKYLKNAELSFEDEPYSYLIASVSAPGTIPQESPPSLRIIGHPKHRKGHILLDVCTGEEIKTQILSAKDPGYKSAKNLDWGDSLPEDHLPFNQSPAKAPKE